MGGKRVDPMIPVTREWIRGALREAAKMSLVIDKYIDGKKSEHELLAHASYFTGYVKSLKYHLKEADK